MKVFYLEYRTVSGEAGREGAWIEEPRFEEQIAFMKRTHPNHGWGEHEARTIFWSLAEFNVTNKISLSTFPNTPVTET